MYLVQIAKITFSEISVKILMHCLCTLWSLKKKNPEFNWTGVENEHCYKCYLKSELKERVLIYFSSLSVFTHSHASCTIWLTLLWFRSHHHSPAGMFYSFPTIPEPLLSIGLAHITRAWWGFSKLPIWNKFPLSWILTMSILPCLGRLHAC